MVLLLIFFIMFVVAVVVGVVVDFFIRCFFYVFTLCLNQFNFGLKKIFVFCVSN
jgi:hypothetical protein